MLLRTKTPIVFVLSIACWHWATPNFSSPQTAGEIGQPARLKILVVHGPNLNLLGRREPHIYGVTTLAQINEQLQKLAAELNVELIFVQSNHEGVIVDTFHKHMDEV